MRIFGDGGHVKGLASVVLDSGEEEEGGRVCMLVDCREDSVGGENGGWGYRVNEDKGRGFRVPMPLELRYNGVLSFSL